MAGKEASEGDAGEETALRLTSLPEDLLARILVLAGARAASVAACCNRRLRCVSGSSSLVWQPLCDASFGELTRPKQWLEHAHESLTFKHLFRSLSALALCIGVFSSSDRPRGRLAVFRWRNDHVEGSEVFATSPSSLPHERLLCRFRLSTHAEDGHTMLSSVSPLGFILDSEASQSSTAASERAERVTAAIASSAALGTSPDLPATPSTPFLSSASSSSGSSPPPTVDFARELGRFMSGRISPSNSSRPGSSSKKAKQRFSRFGKLLFANDDDAAAAAAHSRSDGSINDSSGPPYGRLRGLWAELDPAVGKPQVLELEDRGDGTVRARKVLSGSGVPAGELAWCVGESLGQEISGDTADQALDLESEEDVSAAPRAGLGYISEIDQWTSGRLFELEHGEALRFEFDSAYAPAMTLQRLCL
jgi:hypothetical protein